jgi:hypothetical protein
MTPQLMRSASAIDDVYVCVSNVFLSALVAYTCVPEQRYVFGSSV